LADVLAAGPHVERSKYDPAAALRQAQQEANLAEEVDTDAQKPWEANGKHWHMVDRVSHNGKPCRWEGSILDWIDKQGKTVGNFDSTNWNHRSVIEIAAPVRSHGWFLHAMTGQEWYVRLAFRVAKNTFRAEELNRRLAIPTFNDTKGVEYYSGEP